MTNERFIEYQDKFKQLVEEFQKESADVHVAVFAALPNDDNTMDGFNYINMNPLLILEAMGVAIPNIQKPRIDIVQSIS